MSATLTSPRPSTLSRVAPGGMSAGLGRRRRRSGVPANPVTKRPKPIPGVEIRKHQHRGMVYFKFRVRFTNAFGERDQETFDTPHEALDFKAKVRLMGRRETLEDLDIGLQPLVEFLPVFWKLYAKRKLAPVTRRKYRSAWNSHILPRPIAHMPMRKITPLVLTEYITELEEDGVSVDTIRKVLGMLQSMYHRAVEWGKASRNVVKEIQKPIAPRKRAIVPLSIEVVERIRAHMLSVQARGQDPLRGIRDATLVSILGYTGMRPEEAIALECRHPGENTILVEQKVSLGLLMAGQKTARPPRSPRLFSPVRGDIAAYRLAAGVHDGLLFTIDGKPWSDSAYRNWRRRCWQPACVAVGVGRIEPYKRADGSYGNRYVGAVPYDLRHSFASLLIHEGELSVVEIANQLGHSVETLLRVYAHVIAEMKGKPKVPAEIAIAQARKKVHGNVEPAQAA
jgi:integrase